MKIGGGMIIGVLIGGSQAFLELEELVSLSGVLLIITTVVFLFLGIWFLSKPYGKISKTKIITYNNPFKTVEFDLKGLKEIYKTPTDVCFVIVNNDVKELPLGSVEESVRRKLIKFLEKRYNTKIEDS